MTEVRKLTCVLKVPQEVQIQYSPEVMATNPDKSVDGMLAIVWEYEAEGQMIDSVTAKQHILGSLESGMAMVPTENYTVEKLAQGIQQAIVKCELLSEPKLDETLDDSVIQVSIADMSESEYDHFNRPLEGVKFKFDTKH